MSTKPGLTVLHINNVDPELRNRFKGICAVNGLTLKDGVLRLIQLAVDRNSLYLEQAPRITVSPPIQKKRQKHYSEPSER